MLMPVSLPANRYRIHRWTTLAIFLCLDHCELLIKNAAAQPVNPSGLAPASSRPAARGSFKISISGDGTLSAPANADKVFATVRRVAVDGGFPELEFQTAVQIGEIEGRRVSLAEVYQFASALQQAYSNYPLARVVVLPEDFRTGVVRIAVIDGFVEGVDLSRVPERARNLVRARLEPLIGKRHVTQAEMKRRVLLLGDIAGLTGNCATKQGSSFGATILAVELTEKLVSASNAVNNRLEKNLGTWEFTNSVEVNNPLGWGEQFYASASSSSDFDHFFDGTSKFQAYSGGVILPIGFDGFRLNAGYLTLRTRPTPLSGSLPIQDNGEFSRAHLQAIYPIILTPEQSLRVQAAYEYVTSRGRESALQGAVLPDGFGGDQYRDRYNVVRFAAEWGFQLPWAWGGKTVSAAVFSRGLVGRTAEDAPLVGPPLSQPGSSPEFNKLGLNMRIYQPLPQEFQLSLIARTQTSFGAPLMLSEQLSLDGADALSGFAAGSLNVDSGATVRPELSRPLRIDLGSTQIKLVPYIFGAWGRGVLNGPFTGNSGAIEAESFGGGLRTDTTITGSPFGESLHVEFAKNFSNIPLQRSSYRTNFGLVVRF